MKDRASGAQIAAATDSTRRSSDKQSPPLVSIVINNYNYGEFLGQAIDSALAQTHGNVEVIVVDDGSTDDSLSVLARYKDCITVVQKANGGQASAFNAGVAKARGDYVLLLDADDFLFPEAVATSLAHFPKGYARVYYRLRPVDGNGEPIAAVPPNRFFRPFDGDMYKAGRESGAFLWWPPTSANFFRADVLRSTLPVPEDEYRICADAYVLACTALRGAVKSIDQELAAYRLHGANHFSTAAFRFAEVVRLKNYLEHHYRTRKLLQTTCRQAGFAYVDPPDTAIHSILKALVVGYREGMQSDFVRSHTRRSLAKLIWHHLKSDSGSWAGRSARVVYLYMLLFAPMTMHRLLVHAMDWKEALRLRPWVS
jgi:glycosyltransferase involved in cell wall biosynthesis